MVGLLNLGSLIFGLVAWVLPIISLMVQAGGKERKWLAFLPAASFSACSISLSMQLFGFNSRVMVQDWSALQDTSYAITTVSAVLLLVTVVLNAVAFAVSHGRKSKG